MQSTLFPSSAVATVNTIPSSPYAPEEGYCDFCSTSPCSCVWAEDREMRIDSPVPSQDPKFASSSVWWRTDREFPLLGLDPELGEREEPRPPPPKPLPPKLPPLDF